MYIAYLDESGDLGDLSDPPKRNDQPVFTIAILMVNQARLTSLVPEFLQIKRNYFPGLCSAQSEFLSAILKEVKGADLRRDIADGPRNKTRHAIRFLNEVIELCIRSGSRMVAKSYVKKPGMSNDSRAAYTASCQTLFSSFDHYLSTVRDVGFCIADSRNPGLNIPVSHSIFTQMFSTRAPHYPRIMELPTFGHSDNHVGLQIMDLLASALVCPAVIHEYCLGHINNIHVKPRYSIIRARFTPQLKRLLYRYQDSEGRWRGGVTISDSLAKRPSSNLFKNAPHS
jgi:hypothetical protein